MTASGLGPDALAHGTPYPMGYGDGAPPGVPGTEGLQESSPLHPRSEVPSLVPGAPGGSGSILATQQRQFGKAAGIHMEAQEWQPVGKGSGNNYRKWCAVLRPAHNGS